MTDDTSLTLEDIEAIFNTIRQASSTSVHPLIDSIERLYRIECARHAVARIRIINAQAALDVVYGHRVYGDNADHSRRVSDLKAV